MARQRLEQLCLLLPSDYFSKLDVILESKKISRMELLRKYIAYGIETDLSSLVEKATIPEVKPVPIEPAKPKSNANLSPWDKLIRGIF
jgi:hypothetical protein